MFITLKIDVIFYKIIFFYNFIKIEEGANLELINLIKNKSIKKMKSWLKGQI